MNRNKNIDSNKAIKKYIVFRLGEEEYGLDVMDVKSIERLSPITRVPKSEYFVLGVINLRGDIIPIIDTRKKMGLPSKAYDEQTRIIIARSDDYSVGIIVDSVVKVLDVYEEDIQLSDEVFEGKEQKFVTGVIKIDSEIVLILDHNELLEKEEARGEGDLR